MFAHVNIVNLPGHSADVDVLLQQANLDLLGVTESRLDNYMISDGNICPDGYACYGKDRNRNGGRCALFVKKNGLANEEPIWNLTRWKWCARRFVPTRLKIQYAP